MLISRLDELDKVVEHFEAKVRDASQEREVWREARAKLESLLSEFGTQE